MTTETIETRPEDPVAESSGLATLLPMSSGRHAIQRSSRAQITSAPQRCPVEVLDLTVVSGAVWRVHGLRVGHHAQLPPTLGTPTAAQLSRLLRAGEVRVGSLQVAQDFCLEVEYVG